MLNKTVQDRYNDQEFRGYVDAVLYETIGILFNDDGWQKFVYRFSRADIPIIKKAKEIFLKRFENKEINGGIDGQFKYLMKIIHNLKTESQLNQKGYKVVGMGRYNEND